MDTSTDKSEVMAIGECLKYLRDTISKDLLHHQDLSLTHCTTT